MNMTKNVIAIPAKTRTEIAGASIREKPKIRVAAYCRVSTEQDEQLNSFENQVNYYTDYITKREDYELAGIYADEGITGTQTKKREEFMKMIRDCEAGKIDFIITKSISRFARNTQDCLIYTRKLKNLGIGIKFEKENINTMDGTGELLFTILSSLAQDESRSISENCRWGIRTQYKAGIYHINTDNFLGFNKDENGKLVINEEEAKIIKWMYEKFLDGNDPSTLAQMLNAQGIPTCKKKTWVGSTIKNMLRNEKYMGDARLQKTFISDYLTNTKVKNDGHLPQYYITDDHEAIVSREIWEAANMELDRRENFKQQHGLRKIKTITESDLFASKVICGKCGRAYKRRTYTRTWGYKRVWTCSQHFVSKGVSNCDNEKVNEEVLHDALRYAWNEMINNRESMLKKWEHMKECGNSLERYRARRFIELSNTSELTSEDWNFANKVMECCEVHPRKILIIFLDGTKISYSI